MPASDTDEPDFPPGFIGFHTNADDTPRHGRAQAWADEPDEGLAWQGDPRAGFPSYAHDSLWRTDEFALPPYWDADGDPLPRSSIAKPERARGPHLGAALAVALVAGAAGALAWVWQRPAPQRRIAPVAAAAAPSVPAEPAPAPAPAPPSLAMSLRGALAPPAPIAPPRPQPAATPAPAPSRPVEIAEATAQAKPAPAPPEAQPAPPVATPPPPEPAATSACAGAATLSQQMVCEDPELALAERRMNRAYRNALAAGAPEDQLRTEQQDWLSIREDAARHSRRAVANIYEQRIEDLRQWRDEAQARNPQP